MSGRAQRLDRLLVIRRLGEELDRRTLTLALASVAQVERALDDQKIQVTDARQIAHDALDTGDRSEWLMADAQTEVAGWNTERLGVLLEARASEVPPAMAKFMESRCEHEQVKKLIENAQEVERIEEGRRAQAASDDWFLSKRLRLSR